jgi:hypothetical protein
MRYLIAIAAALTVILTAGCIDYEQTITINEDLSGDAEFNIGMNPYMGENMNEDGSMSETPSNFLVKDYSNVAGCKIVSDSYSYDPDIELEHYSIGLKFDNLNDINGYGLYEQDKTLSVTEEDGVITYREEVVFHNEEPPPNPIDESEMSDDERMIREMMEGFTFTYRVVMPGAVTETNGEIDEDGRTVTWIWPASEFIQLGDIEVFAKCAK